MVISALFLAVSLAAPPEAGRPRWDQAAAEAKVRRVLEIERKGQPWDQIAWQTDPTKAGEAARRENKPVLVYFYLRKAAGPPTAPC